MPPSPANFPYKHAPAAHDQPSSSFDSERASLPNDNDESAANTPFITEEASSPSTNPPGPTKPSLTFLNGLALILSLQIGSGIFSAPSQVSAHVPSAGPAVLVWLCAGLLVWTGAASFIELGLAIPANGGVQEYLRASYGEFWGFLFTWVYIGIAKPCANAIIAMVFAENVGIALNPEWSMPAGLMKVVAVGGVAGITFVNCLGSRTGAKVAVSFLVLKLFAVFSIAVVGIGVRLGAGGQDRPSLPEKWFTADPDPERQNMRLWATAGEYITAVYGAIFCYGGWETIGFVAGDLINPSRNLPRAITTAMITAITGFVLMNIALFTILPFEQVRERSVVAVDFGLQAFGPWGGFLYALIVSISCLGALNANVFATGRLCVAASRQDYAPRVLANRHCAAREGDALATRKAVVGWLPALGVRAVLWFAGVTEGLRWEGEVPIYAMMGNSAIAILFTVVGTFDSLVTFIGIAEYTFFLLATAGIFILRRQPSRQHHTTTTTTTTSTPKVPYRTYTVVVVIFCVFAACLVVRGVITDPIQGLAIAALGVVAWNVFRRRSL